MTENLENKLKQLKVLEDQLKLISEEKESLRKEVLEVLEKENIKTLKTDTATVSQVERKTVKFNVPREEVLARLEKERPEFIEVIPEHKELNKDFEKAVKSGELSLEEVELQVSYSTMIKFK